MSGGKCKILTNIDTHIHEWIGLCLKKKINNLCLVDAPRVWALLKSDLLWRGFRLSNDSLCTTIGSKNHEFRVFLFLFLFFFFNFFFLLFNSFFEFSLLWYDMFGKKKLCWLCLVFIAIVLSARINVNSHRESWELFMWLCERKNKQTNTKSKVWDLTPHWTISKSFAKGLRNKKRWRMRKYRKRQVQLNFWREAISLSALRL